MKRLTIIILLCSLSFAQGIGGNAGAGGKAGFGGAAAGGSGPTYVQDSAGEGSVFSGTSTLAGGAFGSNVTSGDRVSLMVLSDATGVTIASISGCTVTWTLLDNTVGADGSMFTYDGNATGTAACTPTIHYTATQFAAVVIIGDEISNTTGVDVHGMDAAEQSIGSTTVTAKTVTTTGSNRFISCSIGSTSNAASGSGTTAGTGNTLAGSVATVTSSAMEYQTTNQASAGPTSNTFTAPVSFGSWLTACVAYK